MAPKFTRWGDTPLDFLKANCMRMTDVAIAQALTRLTGSVYTENQVFCARHRYTNVKKKQGGLVVEKRAYREGEPRYKPKPPKPE